MTSPTGSTAAPPTRKPTDDELDVYGLTHRGQGPEDQPGPFPDLLAAQADAGAPHEPLRSRPDARPGRAAGVSRGGRGRCRRQRRRRDGEPARGQRRHPVHRREHAVLLCLARRERRRASSPRSRTPPCTATRTSSRSAATSPTSRAWPRRSRSGSASGRAPTCCRWATAAATSCATASSPSSRATRPWPRSWSTRASWPAARGQPHAVGPHALQRHRWSPDGADRHPSGPGVGQRRHALQRRAHPPRLRRADRRAAPRR